MSRHEDSLKIIFYALDGIGHLNACVGLSQALAKRGHRIYFLHNDAFEGQFSKFGFEEILLKQTDNSTFQHINEATQLRNPVKEMAEMSMKKRIFGPKSPTEKLKAQLEMSENDIEKIYNQAMEYNPQIGSAIEGVKPNLIILDSRNIDDRVPFTCETTRQ